MLCLGFIFYLENVDPPYSLGGGGGEMGKRGHTFFLK